MWSILRGEPTAIETWGLYLLLAGMALVGLSFLGLDYGIITGFFAVGLGASGGAFTKWLCERGLWMLAVLFFVIYAFVYVCFCIGQLQDALQGAPVLNVALTVDVAIGTWLLVANLRFLLNVAKENYFVSTSRDGF
jgi:hypothetical protein